MGPGKREALPTGQLPAIDISGLNEADRRALIIADNQLALNAGWDEAMLRSEVEALGNLGFDIALLGFDSAELAKMLLPNDGQTDPDDTPDPPTNPVSKLGDVWLLGKHRIVCGDSTDADTVAACLNGVKPHLMVTDPPYGVEYDASWRNDAGPGVNGTTQRVSSGKAKPQNTSGRALGLVSNDDRADWREAYALFPGDVAYVWHSGTKAAEVAESLVASGFDIRTQIIWNKSSLVIGRGHYHPKHEPLWYAVRKGATGHWKGDKKQTTVWDIERPRKSETGHSTQKPVECMKRPIENNSSPGQAVYEPFSGSGTTIIAGEMTGRSVHAIELNPAYVDVAVMRWQAFTGHEARLEQSGRSFAEVAAERST